MVTTQKGVLGGYIVDAFPLLHAAGGVQENHEKYLHVVKTSWYHPPAGWLTKLLLLLLLFLELLLYNQCLREAHTADEIPLERVSPGGDRRNRAHQAGNASQ